MRRSSRKRQAPSSLAIYSLENAANPQADPTKQDIQTPASGMTKKGSPKAQTQDSPTNNEKENNSALTANDTNTNTPKSTLPPAVTPPTTPQVPTMTTNTNNDFATTPFITPTLTTTKKVVRPRLKVDFYYYSPQGEKFRTENPASAPTAPPASPGPATATTTNTPTSIKFQTSPSYFGSPAPSTLPPSIFSSTSTPSADHPSTNGKNGEEKPPRGKTGTRVKGAAKKRKTTSSSPPNGRGKRKKDEQTKEDSNGGQTKKRKRKVTEGEGKKKKTKSSETLDSGMTVLGAGEYYSSEQKEAGSAPLKIVIRKKKQTSDPSSTLWTTDSEEGTKQSLSTRRRDKPRSSPLPFLSSADVATSRKKESSRKQDKQDEEEEGSVLHIDEEEWEEGKTMKSGENEDDVTIVEKRDKGKEKVNESNTASGANASHQSWFEVVLGDSRQAETKPRSFFDIVLNSSENQERQQPASPAQTQPPRPQPKQRVRIHRVETEEEQWNRRCQEVKEFRRNYGHCNVPVGWRAPEHPEIEYVPDEEPLGEWVNLQRLLEEKGLLRPDRKKRLEQIGLSWNPRGWDWFQQLAEIHKVLAPTTAQAFPSLLTGGLFFPSFASLLSSPSYIESVALSAGLPNQLELLLKERYHTSGKF